MHDFQQMHMHDVVELAQDNNQAAYNYIFRCYKGIIHNLIKKYFLQGGDNEDLYQEALIGLYKAIRDFKKDFGSFKAFSKMCMDRQIISAIKGASRFKHDPLNKMISLDRPLPDNDNLTMTDIVVGRDDVQYSVDLEMQPPDKQLVLRETYENQQKMFHALLSEPEHDIFKLYLENKSYQEIMEELNIEKHKTIDNALQRAKRKIQLVKEMEKSNNSIRKIGGSGK